MAWSCAGLESDAAGSLRDPRQGADRVDVLGEKEKAKREAAQTVIVGEVVPIYLSKRAGELWEKSYIEAERYLTKTWRPLHALPIKEITRQTLVCIIDGMERKITADRARVARSHGARPIISRLACEVGRRVDRFQRSAVSARAA